MKKGLFGILGAMFAVCSFAAALTGCDSGGGGGGGGGGTKPPESHPSKLVEVIPTVYDNDEVVSADETEAGSYDAWIAQRMLKGGTSNDDGTPNSLIKSPWHTLKINDTAVPVYTARCGTGAHSYAWVDIVDAGDDFQLKVELTMDKTYAQCVVLPLSREVSPSIDGNKITSLITECGSFTYTFSTRDKAKATDPTLAPLTIMVSREEKLKVPVGYDTVEIEAGTHGNEELEFTSDNTYYIFKKGVHNFLSINIPSNSVIWLERGAYLKADDRVVGEGEGKHASTGKDAIHSTGTENAKLRGRGLLDTGSLQGGWGKWRNPIGFGGCTSPEVSGLTIVNGNCWTLCFTNCDGVLMERNLLLSYRTFSDGLMMSDCNNGKGRYNFVRTGDDAIEFKGTGWSGYNDGENCVYEYNDLWTDKGSGYCLTWESDCNMSNMIFRNNSVGFAQPVWNANCNALDVRMGTNKTKRWGDVTFKNIEIYHVISPNVVTLQSECGIIDNIVFENISVRSAETGVRAILMDASADGVITDITVKNYDYCGNILTEADKENALVIKFSGTAARDQLTVS